MLRLLTGGESHGPCLTAILEGMPAGLPLRAADLNRDLARRQVAFGAGGRMKIEKDAVSLLSGVVAGRTTGAPITIQIANLDFSRWRAREIAPFTRPRPGHADLVGAIKYGHRDLRLALERASARETASRVAAGAACRALLAALGIRVGSYVTMIGGVEAAPLDHLSHEERFALAEESDVRCPDAAAAAAMRARIREIMRAGDTLGGVFEVVALGAPPGLGSYAHWDRRLDGRLLGALGSIPAVKGAEIGEAFQDAGRPGSAAHDELFLAEDDSGAIVRRSNRAGGLEGGVTSGAPIVLRAAMKPISTTLTPRHTVDLAAGAEALTEYERSDFSAVPRAAVVGEAMVAYVLCDALLEKLGGDSLDEIRPRFEALRRARLSDLPMDGLPWRLEYELQG